MICKDAAKASAQFIIANDHEGSKASAGTRSEERVARAGPTEVLARRRQNELLAASLWGRHSQKVLFSRSLAYDGPEAGMAELADANDSRSFDRKVMRVQVSLPAHMIYFLHVSVLREFNFLG